MGYRALVAAHMAKAQRHCRVACSLVGLGTVRFMGAYGFSCAMFLGMLVWCLTLQSTRTRLRRAGYLIR